MDTKKLLKITSQFKNKKIIVVGDIMLDDYIFGDIKGKSPEAPVLLVRTTDRKYIPGGAGNAAVNLAALGAKVYLVGIKGKDTNGEILMFQLKNYDINTDCILDEKMPTITKTRIICEGQQMIRYDTEQKKNPITHIKKISEFIRKRIRDIDGILISDYNKGMHLFNQEVIELCNKNKKFVVVDSKSMDYKINKKASLFTPNYYDALRMIGSSYPANILAKILSDEMLCDVLITMGSEGMLLYADNHPTHLPTNPIEKCDATGAGDTVSATALLALCSGATKIQAATIAQIAARVVVQKTGTANITQEELDNETNKL